MKKTTVLLIVVLSLTLPLVGCGLKDPVTGDPAHNNLRGTLIDIFKGAPADPIGMKGEFETSEEYQSRVSNQIGEYVVTSSKYYGRITQNTYYILHEIEELPEFNADLGHYSIPFRISTVPPSASADNAGPNFRLFVPPNVIEKVHLYNETYAQVNNRWYRSEFGATGEMEFLASMDANKAAEIRYASQIAKIYLRIGVQFEFPRAYEGFRFLPNRYEPLKELQEEKSIFESPAVAQLKEEDLAYGETRGMITVKLVLVEIVDENGNILHQWERGLIAAKTPTPVGTQTATPTPTPFIISTTTPKIPEPTSTEDGFCPEAMEMRMKVGDKGRVTYGDPRRVRARIEPSTSAAVFEMLELGKEFRVVGGPECADGFVWWEIEYDNHPNTYWVAEGENDNYHIEPLE